jgi:hypothetical protein
MRNHFNRAVTFARRAADTSLSEAERATATAALTKHVAQHKLSLADVTAAAAKAETQPRQPLTPKQKAARDAAAAKLAAAAKPSTPRPEAEQPKADPKPEPEAPKAEASQPQPEAAKPTARDIERERAHANRATVAKHYNGASLASHATRAPKLSEALARVASPIQRAKSASARDESGLALAETLADDAGTFCPLAGTFDLGVLSRLASLGFLSVAGDRIQLSPAARDLARNVIKRAA